MLILFIFENFYCRIFCHRHRHLNYKPSRRILYLYHSLSLLHIILILPQHLSQLAFLSRCCKFGLLCCCCLGDHFLQPLPVTKLFYLFLSFILNFSVDVFWWWRLVIQFFYLSHICNLGYYQTALALQNPMIPIVWTFFSTENFKKVKLLCWWWEWIRKMNMMNDGRNKKKKEELLYGQVVEWFRCF